ncbi:MAG: ankyrin repeat domain-containing protein, partial [Nitrososphaeraceae archaeon]|nr:ankyrin repeat domain-containing protein [Nitrososphaeraceae archaeon]
MERLSDFRSPEDSNKLQKVHHANEGPPSVPSLQSKVHIPVGETALSHWNTTYPKLYEYQSLIGSITPENFDETVKYLINDKIQIPIILCLAAESGDIKLVEILSEYGGDISYINQARACAALKNNLEIVKFLTEKFQLKFSQATLYNAAHSCSIEIIKYLCDYYPKEMTTYEIIESVLKIAMYKKSEFAIDILAELLRHTPQPQIEILNVQNLSASVEGEVLFKGVDLNMAKGDKIVLFSKDSRATTAFYEILNGNQKADSGIFDWGVTTNQAYLPGDNHSFFESD